MIGLRHSIDQNRRCLADTVPSRDRTGKLETVTAAGNLKRNLMVTRGRPKSKEAWKVN
jgi:hypothetical protein